MSQDFARLIEDKKNNGVGKFNWSVSKNARQKLPSLGINFPSEYSNDAERLNVEIRRSFSEAWKSVQQQGAIARWIIGDWGGIGGNKDTKIERILEICNSRSDHPFDGISSYSKVLSFLEPEGFFVYDSRVALSLNWIQICLGKRATYFHIPLSQAKNALMASLICESSYASYFSEIVHKDKIYQRYIEFIKEVAKYANKPPLEIEMFLFSYAEVAECEILNAHNLTPFKRRKQKTG
ncbi:MAG: hypothetical protein ACRCTD_10620 [Beijerinckiaceae bacterium]